MPNQRVTTAQRRKVVNRARGCCEYCQSQAPLYHPRRQIWIDHFRWNEDYTLIIGLTPTGRATVEALRLNRPELINLRRILYVVGEHPPK